MGLIVEKFNDLDKKAFVWVISHTRNNYEKLIKTISKTGDGYFYFAIGLILLTFEPNSGEVFFLIALTAYAIEVGLYLFLKNTIKRDRPEEAIQHFSALIIPSDKFSFPSGHTAAAFVFATMVMHFYPAFGLFAYVWASMIGASRVLLGVHYPGDILAGATLGTVVATSTLDALI